jgi:tRNA (guanine-N7-)-methyltransferase
MAVSPGRRPISSPPSSRARSDVTDGTPDAPAETRRRRLLYGRRKGPKLSAHQDQLLETLLPKLRLNLQSGLDPRKYFSGGEISDVWLEIGFGAGEHLLWQAEHHPDVGLIGAEPYISGIAKLLSRISLSPIGGEGEGEGVSTQFGSSKQASTPPHPVATLSLPPPLPHRGGGENIRIYDNDARDILEALPDACLGRVFILFPDPWPKSRHHKRRFIQTNTLDALARAMKSGAELRFASDDADYAAWTLERVIAHPAFEWTATCAMDWKTRASDWPQTRYETKALHGPPAYFAFRKKL